MPMSKQEKEDFMSLYQQVQDMASTLEARPPAAVVGPVVKGVKTEGKLTGPARDENGEALIVCVACDGNYMPKSHVRQHAVMAWKKKEAKATS